MKMVFEEIPKGDEQCGGGRMFQLEETSVYSFFSFIEV